MALECERHEGLHVASAAAYMEILRPDGTPSPPGEEGEIVVTSLTSYAMPLIRYRIGDMGVWAQGPCTCGRSGRVLARVAGRVMHTFVSPAGLQVDGRVFSRLIPTYAGEFIDRWRVVQESEERLDIYLQPAREMTAADRDRVEQMRALAQKAMGADCLVSVNLVPHIEPVASGKHVPTISKVGGRNGARG